MDNHVIISHDGTEMYNLYEVLAHAKEKIVEYLKDGLIDLVLFGSYARGDFNEDSDIDLFLLYDERIIDHIKVMDAIVEVEFELDHDFPGLVSFFNMSLEKYEKKGLYPILKHIDQEGVSLWKNELL